MKRIIFTIIISFIAIFYTGCEEIANILESQSGCMLPDAPNYNASALLACTTECVGDQTGANCCCEEIIYGCMDSTAVNYYAVANVDDGTCIYCSPTTVTYTTTGFGNEQAFTIEDASGTVLLSVSGQASNVTTTQLYLEFPEQRRLDDFPSLKKYIEKAENKAVLGDGGYELVDTRAYLRASS